MSGVRPDFVARKINPEGQWGGATQYYSSSAFDMIGGMLGFACHSGVGTVDDVTIKSWNTSTSQFDVTEHVETFDIDGNGYSSNAPAHDAAGNMTFDGTARFTYDGWNRLVGVAHAYCDGSNNVQAGQKHVTMSYDGRGRVPWFSFTPKRAGVARGERYAGRFG